MRKTMERTIILCFMPLFCASCETKDMYAGYWVDDLNDISNAYLYPFKNASQNTVAEITIETDGNVDLNNIVIQIPHLKYNKEVLVMLTQDDCKQSAFCRTWAAIHNRPLTKYYYDLVHLKADDLPSDIDSYNKTLGSTDGFGNEVRFSFTTTIAPEWDYMDAKSEVALRPETNNNRFAMKSGLNWRNLIEMLNYDVSIAFHDVKTEAIQHIDSIKKHYTIAQEITLKKLSGRGCKVLAEPNGNKTYVQAALEYAPIQAMTAQAGTTVIYPFTEERDLHKALQHREFITVSQAKSAIEKAVSLRSEDRSAIHIGVHNTDQTWTDFLLWVNNKYGKDGSDVVWMPGFEEYYEYNYNRVNGTVEKTVEGKKVKIKVTLPGSQYFYFPSTTINLTGINMSNVVSVTSNDAVTGLSYGNLATAEAAKFNLTLHLDCRKSLAEHAEQYVKEYEVKKSDDLLRADALYFIKRIKDPDMKTKLLNRIK